MGVDGDLEPPERGSSLYLPEDGAGLVYGPDGKPASSGDEGDGRRPGDGREAPPEAECDYCGKTEEKRKRPGLPFDNSWHLPKEWRKLPNGLVECPGCRPVKDVETGRMVRPDPEVRG